MNSMQRAIVFWVRNTIEEARKRLRTCTYKTQIIVNRNRVMVMSLDDVLLGVIVGGFGLCAAYFRDAYIRWREHRAAEMRKEMRMRELHINRFSHREDADSIRDVLDLEELADTETSADTERSSSLGSTPAAPTPSPRRSTGTGPR
jgi:hypothetical protein